MRSPFFENKCNIYLFSFFQTGAEGENVLTRGGREFSLLQLFLPAAFDVTASVILLTGLYLTYVSSFQMLRGE